MTRMLSSEEIFETIISTQSLMGFPVRRFITMDFQHRYYKVNKILLMMIGQWPYQTAGTRCSIIVVWTFIGSSHIIAEIAACIKHRNDLLVLLECVVQLFFIANCIIKQYWLNKNSQKMLELMNHILTDWKVWTLDSEADILHRYADHGRKLTIVYTVSMYLVGFIFMAQPVVPKIVDVILKNGSEVGEVPIPVDFQYFDISKYYFYVVMYSFFCGCFAILLMVAADCLFIVYVQHGCGIFAALGHRLEKLGDNEISIRNEEITLKAENRDIDFEYLVSCINRHNEVIEYAELLEASYVWSFIFIIGLNIIMISISGVQIINRINHPEEIIKIAVWFVSDLIHLFIESYMGQIFMDHSISIRYYIHNSKWYTLSPKAQKLLPLMLMRCNKPCKLTVGKIAVISMESFTQFMKASVSYLTLLRSM